MSSSLVRKGLELFSDDQLFGNNTSNIRKKKNKLQSMRRQDLMSVISTNRKGVKKQLKRLQDGNGPKEKATVKEKKIKSAFAKLHNHTQEDMTDRNLQYLLRMSDVSSSTSRMADQILEHSRGRLARDNPLQEEIKEKEASAFSEDDFRKFEEEYSGKKSKHLIQPYKKGKRTRKR